jgi:hypothetical protein
MRILLLLLILMSALVVPSMSDAKVKPKTPGKQSSHVYGAPSVTDDPGYLKGTNIPWRTTAPASN